ncbi:ABC transporter substrate-binding protein [Cohnella sp. GCM10020058]|uniref:ABC transporter substrate-binding protein n=1 Tax=Cohnella sp. GCM10020058 TaxID=3317330 RepID=UPI00363321E2
MIWNDRLLLWNEASVKLLDIRHQKMAKGDELRNYKLPSSAFLWMTRGRGQVLLNGNGYTVNGFHLLHGGKGMRLDVFSSEDNFEYYLVLYKALMAFSGNRYLNRLMKYSNPFRMEYEFVPHDPLALHMKIQTMEQSWSKYNLPDRLYAKGVLYQFASELFGQMAAQKKVAVRVDLVSQAMRYIEESYSEPITVEGLAGRLGCSSSFLSRLFKQQRGTTPIEYLTRIRIAQAIRLLSETKATLQEITSSIGYLDVYYFSRVFKKQTGLPPLRFRSLATEKSVQKSPFFRSDQAIVRHNSRQYNDNDSHFEPEGDLTMMKDLKMSVGTVMLLCMALLFGGCTNSTGSTDLAVASGTSTTVAQNQLQTKVVKHLMGKSEIPNNPQRIAVNGLEDIMLALDAPMVHAQSLKGQYLYDRLQEKKIPSVYTPGSINFESILDSKPDLIVANLLASDQASYDQLSKIAPTIVYDRSDWRSSIIAIGEAINREDKAASIIQAYDEKLSKAKAAIIAKIGADRTIAFIRPSNKDVQLFFPAFSYTSIAYKDLGMTLDPVLAKLQEKEEEGSWGIEASLETLPDLSADYLFVTAGGSFDSEDEATAALDELTEVENLAVWKKIPAVQQGHVYKMSARHWMLNGPTADNMKIDDVLAAFQIQFAL